MKQLLIFLFILLTLTSCRSVQYVEKPVEVEKIKTEYKNLIQHDSIYVKDSVYVYSKGDTVYNTRYNTKYRFIESHDTIIQRDTIPYQVTITEVKEVNILKKWQKILMALGALSLIVGGTIVFVKLKKII